MASWGPLVKKYKVYILREAINDLQALRINLINKYHDEHSTNIVISKIFDKIESLEVYPGRTQVRLVVSGVKMRFIRAGKYTVAYAVDGDASVVKVYGIFHSRRDIFAIAKGRA